jgi:hypothetical protein
MPFKDASRLGLVMWSITNGMALLQENIIPEYKQSETGWIQERE